MCFEPCRKIQTQVPNQIDFLNRGICRSVMKPSSGIPQESALLLSLHKSKTSNLSLHYERCSIS